MVTVVLLCRSEEKSQNGGAEGESAEAMKEKLRGLEEQLASSQTELEELKEQVRLGVLSVEQLDNDRERDTPGTGGGAEAEEGSRQEAQQLRARVAELEAEIAKREGEADGQSSQDSDTIKQLTTKVEELQAALAKRESTKEEGEKNEEEGEGETVKHLRDRLTELEAALAESRASEKVDAGRESGAGHVEGELVRRLQIRVGELEGELRRCVPRSELEEVQVTLGLQCEQLARERAEVAVRLNEALLELERVRPPSHRDGDDDEEEEEEERSESSEPSITSGVQYYFVYIKYCFFRGDWKKMF